MFLSLSLCLESVFFCLRVCLIVSSQSPLYIIPGDSGVVASNTVLFCNYLFCFKSVSTEGPVAPTKPIKTAVAVSTFMLAFSISAREFEWADSTSRLLSCVPNS